MSEHQDPIKVALVGLGATGAEIGRALDGRTDCQLVAGVDTDPKFAGTDLGSVLGLEVDGVSVVDDIADPSVTTADVAVLATTPTLTDVAPLALSLMGAGVHVASICEELGDPRREQPELAKELDATARRNGVAVLGTGANPGMIMDVLPLVFSSMTQSVERVQVRRAADLSQYGAIVRNFGVGMTAEEFDQAQEAGAISGHTGFAESISLVAEGLEWELDEIEVEPVGIGFLAREERRGEHVVIPAGTVAAVGHGGKGIRDGKTVIDLRSHFGFLQPGDPVQRGDHCLVEGAEQLIEVSSPAGFSSWGSTVAVLANVVASVPAMAPGLRTMADVRVRDLASKGSRRG